jgi:hypothetical protein
MPGNCGCGVADTDTDGDGTADCIDGCPSDPTKTEPGICGCNNSNTPASIASVTGTSPLCVGQTATYTANGVVLGGGTGAWSSNNPTVASVDPSTGLVTSLSAGTTNIIYTIYQVEISL